MKNLAFALFIISIVFSCKKQVEITPCDESHDTNFPIVISDKMVEVDSTTIFIKYLVDHTGHVDGDGITESGIFFSPSNNLPDQNDLKLLNNSSNDKGAKSISLTKSTLSLGTWHFRPFATNCAGTSFGDVISFNVQNDPCDSDILDNLPQIILGKISELGDDLEMKYIIAHLGGNNDGISSRGVCWSKANTSPTINDDHVDQGLVKVLGQYVILESIDKFEKGTDYSFRAFAKNCAGIKYSPVVNYITAVDLCDGTIKDNLAIVTTDEVTEVAGNIQVKLSIDQIGGDATGIASHGICWSLSKSNPTINDEIDDLGKSLTTGSSMILIDAVNIQIGKEYHYRAFATNCAGTSYGEVVDYKIEKDFIKQINDNMIPIAAGSFTMGCTEEQNNSKGCGEGDCFDKECPEHVVMINSFEMNKFELTQEEWRGIMGSDPPKLKNKGCDECPVEMITWDEIHVFIEKLNNLSGEKYRLPSESEWEYAARGGSKSKGYKFAGSDNFKEIGWNGFNTRKTHPVGEKKANEIGLFDMSGNIYEFCEDDYHSDYSAAPIDGSAWVDGPRASNRVLRGGSWINYERNCRVSDRYNDRNSLPSNTNGFRLVRD